MFSARRWSARGQGADGCDGRGCDPGIGGLDGWSVVAELGAGGLSIRVRYLAYAESMTVLIAGRSSAVARRSPSGPAVPSGGVVVIGRPPGLEHPGSSRDARRAHIRSQPSQPRRTTPGQQAHAAKRPRRGRRAGRAKNTKSSRSDAVSVFGLASSGDRVAWTTTYVPVAVLLTNKTVRLRHSHTSGGSRLRQAAVLPLSDRASPIPSVGSAIRCSSSPRALRK